MAARKSTPRKPAPKPALKRGDKVTYDYRGQHPVGTVVSVASKGSSAKTTRYNVKPGFQRKSAGGKSEGSTVVHTGAALHKISDATFQARKKANMAKSKKSGAN